jgi:non-heme chloroperoxidase
MRVAVRKKMHLQLTTFNLRRFNLCPNGSQQCRRESLCRLIRNRRAPGALLNESVRESFWLQGMMAGFPAAYFCIKAFSETDQTEDLKKMDVPTLIMHGDDDQIVPFAASAALQAKLIKRATLKVYKGASHGLCTTLKDQVNEDLFAFLGA